MPGPDARWAVVVPVKPLAQAKSRLSVYGDAGRRSLALAFAADVVAAALRCAVVAAVWVVTDDEEAAREADAAGARVLADPSETGLNAALELGAEAAGGDGGAVAAVLSDLPALLAVDLAAVLSTVPPGGRGHVPDSSGTGTTLLAAGEGIALAAAFGPQSAHAHAAGGATALPAPAGVRRDVDTPEDLRVARALGLGPRSSAAWVALAPLAGGQATVQDWDPATGGTALRDDGARVSLPVGCLTGSALRTLRSGQRLQLHLSRDGDLVRVELPGR